MSHVRSGGRGRMESQFGAQTRDEIRRQRRLRRILAVALLLLELDENNDDEPEEEEEEDEEMGDYVTEPRSRLDTGCRSARLSVRTGGRSVRRNRYGDADEPVDLGILGAIASARSSIRPPAAKHANGGLAHAAVYRSHSCRHKGELAAAAARVRPPLERGSGSVERPPDCDTLSAGATAKADGGAPVCSEGTTALAKRKQQQQLRAANTDSNGSVPNVHFSKCLGDSPAQAGRRRAYTLRQQSQPKMRTAEAQRADGGGRQSMRGSLPATAAGDTRGRPNGDNGGPSSSGSAATAAAERIPDAWSLGDMWSKVTTV